ncbi:MAG: SEL1-like repeat protein, partial [Casimicrobiaceae bacterium]
VTWFRVAGDAGYPAAQLALGRMYLEGRGTARDPTRGFAWLALAAAQKFNGAEEARTAALAALPPEAVTAAQAEARRLGETRLPKGVALDF